MTDTRHKASQDENNTITLSDELPTEVVPSTRSLDTAEIAALRAFFDLLAEWDEALSKSTSQLRD